MMLKILREHWILVLSLFLLLLMSVPLFYFSAILQSLTSHGAAINRVQPQPVCQVGICLNNIMERRWVIERQVWEKAAKNRGLTVQIQVAHNSLARQIRQIRALTQQKVRVLLVVPVSQTGLDPVLQEAKRFGTKIILYDELTAGPADFFCGPDYREIGRIQAEAVIKRTGFQKYLLFKRSANSDQAERVARGQLDILQRRVPKAEVQTVTLADGSAETAALKTRTVLAHQRVEAVLAANDLLTAEIKRYLNEQGIATPFLAGIGAAAATEATEADDQSFTRGLTVVVDYSRLAKAAFAIATRMVDGDKPQSRVTIEYDSHSLPAWFLPRRAIGLSPL
jgi:ABC-type xylose transport system substrate-binding protein